MANGGGEAWPQVVITTNTPTSHKALRLWRARDICFVALVVALAVMSAALPTANPDSYFVQAAGLPVELANWLDSAPAEAGGGTHWAVRRAWALGNMDAFAAAAASCTQLFTIMIAGAAMPSMGESVRGR